MTAKCPSCGEGDVLATFQTFTTWDATAGPTTDTSGPDLDAFLDAACTNDECLVSLTNVSIDRLSRADLCIDGEFTADDDDELRDRWIAAVYVAIGHECSDAAVRHNADGTMTCLTCGAVAPAADDTLTLTDTPED